MAPRAAGVRSPGRPRAFEVDDVLDRAIEVFRERGYEAASMADIERATGLNASSIYNAFGSKESLFQRSLARYEVVRLRGIVDVLAAGSEGLADLHRALDLQLVESVSAWGRSGCLAINSMIEVGPRGGDASELLADFRQRLAEGIALPLDRAVGRGEISADRVPTLAALLVTFTLGAAVLARSGASEAELSAHFEAAHALVDAWRLEP